VAEEDTSVADIVVLVVGGHHQADNTDNSLASDEGAANAVVISKSGEDHGDDDCEDDWRSTEEIGVSSAVTHALEVPLISLNVRIIFSCILTHLDDDRSEIRQGVCRHSRRHEQEGATRERE
jgi:hypothetical protein